ncbi:hypothetical protein K458DRAFT_411883 [Lentithecium fluviatile CBS 122367]|uniref:Uncharacterized protein n=1 Tax=Lentithecium fluviatile CBS 122367 TaxID=1168545 RepID=A0A6G1JQ04_9PLEO|nr:hypothetical protein K458DRAFT_411883 [Lentithecium fluviatile CBS 122367]
MSNQTSANGKEKAKIIIDLTVDVPSTHKAMQEQLPSPVSPPRHAQPTDSTQAGSSKAGPSSSTSPRFTTPVRPGPSTSTPSPTPGTKRKARQALITSWFPAKKPRIETATLELTPDEKRAARESERAARESEKLARADAKRLALQLEKEEKAALKAKADAAKAARAEERRIKKEVKEAELAQKRLLAQWKADWKDWVERHKQPDAEFTIPKNEDMWENHVNATGAKKHAGLTRNELDCLRHCDVKNPQQPAGEEYAPMKMYRAADVEKLVWRKEAIVSGLSQEDEAALLQEGERRLVEKMAKDDEQ